MRCVVNLQYNIQLLAFLTHPYKKVGFPFIFLKSPLIMKDLAEFKVQHCFLERRTTNVYQYILKNAAFHSFSSFTLNFLLWLWIVR